MLRRFKILTKFSVVYLMCTAFVLSQTLSQARMAAKQGEVSKLEKILKNNPEVLEAKADDDYTLLHYVVMWGDKNKEEVTELLLSKEADVNARTVDNNIPLYFAVYIEDVPIVKMLLRYESDVNAVNNSGQTGRILLHGAAVCGHEQLVMSIVNRGGDIFSKDQSSGTLTHSAVQGGILSVIKMMIEKKDEVNEKNVYGLTPLHLAAYFGHIDAVKLLISSKAEINERDFSGKSPYHLALENNQTVIVEFFKIQEDLDTSYEFPVFKDDYISEAKPGNTPEIFAPGIISTPFFDEFQITFAPDGRELFYTLRTRPRDGRIYHSKMADGLWTQPALAPFACDCTEFEPKFSPNSRLIYHSTRPLPGKSELNDSLGLWIVTKKNSEWSEPIPYKILPEMTEYISYPMESNNGNIYFRGSRGIYNIKLEDGDYKVPEVMGPEINGPEGGSHPFIAPDESYIIFDSNGRPDSYGANDLYISFREPDGTWLKAINMGNKINTKYGDLLANVSPDGKYLFFTRTVNNNKDIYWVSAKIIKELRERAHQRIK
jgi:ankyrin repeat protein